MSIRAKDLQLENQQRKELEEPMAQLDEKIFLSVLSIRRKYGDAVTFDGMFSGYSLIC
jgi:hypothetical protein